MKDRCDFTYPDTGREPDYTNWAEGYPKCNTNSHTCAYLNILSTEKNWMTETCGGSEAFACEIEPGRNIHQVSFIGQKIFLFLTRYLTRV